jgi:hypothetical protein
VTNQIDHVLIDTRHKNWITNVRSIRGAECGTDHHLVLVNMKQCIKIVKTSTTTLEKKIDIVKLSNTNIQKEYQVKVSNRFQALAEVEEGEDTDTINENEDQAEDKKEQGIEIGWKTFQKIIKETATEICGNKKQHNSKPWFNDECKTLIVKRRTTRIALLNDQTTENTIKYKEVNAEVNKFLRNQKRQYIKNLLTKAEEDNDKNNTREFYKKVKYFKKGFIPKSTGIKNKKGEIYQTKKQYYRYGKIILKKYLIRTIKLEKKT